MMNGTAEASGEINRLLQANISDETLLQVKKVVLPCRQSDKADCSNPATYRLQSEIRLRRGQTLEGEEERVSSSETPRRPLLVWAYDAQEPAKSFKFGTECQYARDKLDKYNLSTPMDGVGAVDTWHGTFTSVFLIGLLADCSAVRKLNFKTADVPPVQGNFGVHMYDDTVGTVSFQNCAGTWHICSDADNGAPKCHRQCTTTTRRACPPELINMSTYPPEVLANFLPKTKTGDPSRAEPTGTHPILIRASTDIDRYKLTHDEQRDSRGYRRFAAKPAASRRVVPVQYLEISDLTIDEPTKRARVQGIELGSDRSSKYVLIQNIRYFGDRNSTGSIALGFNPPAYISNPVSDVHIRHLYADGGAIGIVLAGAKDVVIESFTGVAQAMTAMMLHPGDAGIGMRNIAVRHSAMKRLRKDRYYDHQIYGLVTVSGRPATVEPGYAVRWPGVTTSPAEGFLHPFGITLAPNWVTQRPEYEERQAISEVRFEHTSFEGEDAGDDPTLDGDYLVQEWLGLANYRPSDGVVNPSTLSFDDCTFRGGRSAIKADDLLVNSNVCYTLYRNMGAPGLAAFKQKVPECFEGGFAYRTPGYAVHMTVPHFKTMLHKLIDNPASGLISNNPNTLSFPYRLSSAAVVEFWQYFRTVEGHRKIEEVFRNYQLFHSNIAVTNSRFIDQKRPAIAAAKAQLHLENNIFSSNVVEPNSSKVFIRWGGNDEVVNRGRSRIVRNTFETDLAGTNIFLSGLAADVVIEGNQHKTKGARKLFETDTPFGAVNFSDGLQVDPKNPNRTVRRYLVPGPQVRSGLFQVQDLVYSGSSQIFNQPYSGKNLECQGFTRPGAISIGSWKELVEKDKTFVIGEQVISGKDGHVYRALISHHPNVAVQFGEPDYYYGETNGDAYHPGCRLQDPSACPPLWAKVADQTAICAPRRSPKNQ